MLAYELYLENRNSNQDAGHGIPIKKIFIDNNILEIDNTTLDEYGSIHNPNKLLDALQKKLDMPIDVTTKLNLPKKIVASRSPRPYVTILGSIKIQNKKDKISGSITLSNTNKEYFAVMSIPDYEQEIKLLDIPFYLDKEQYLLDGKPLYDAYCKNKIIVNDTMPGKLFQSVAIKFFEFVKNKDIKFPSGKSSFRLYLLPNNNTITHNAEQEIHETSQIDSFGNEFSQYSDSTTTGVFFLSYDDAIFSINCKQKKNFYKNLGIGKETLKKILLPNNRMMNISGYMWYFVNLDDPNENFVKKQVGIYAQLYNIFKQMSSNAKTTETKPNLLAFCLKKNNSQLEVMINENLSMPRLSEIFESVNDNNIQNFAFEALIITRGKKTIYSYYMAAIKSLLNQTPFDISTLNRIFLQIIRKDIYKWLDSKYEAEAKEFFLRAEFCKQHLKTSNEYKKMMENQTEFAKKIGCMAQVYIKFREKQGFQNNSFKTILTKPKYDIKTLQNVVKEIGRSIHLLKLEPKIYEEIRDKISNATPTDPENPDLKQDMSYHFYLGYFGKDIS